MNKLKSRKLWMAVAGAVLVIANEGLGLNLPEDSILALAGILIAYILGQGLVDAKQPPRAW